MWRITVEADGSYIYNINSQLKCLFYSVYSTKTILYFVYLIFLSGKLKEILNEKFVNWNFTTVQGLDENTLCRIYLNKLSKFEI